MDRELESSNNTHSPRRTLSVLPETDMETLPERDNDIDSDKEENENIEADDPSLGQVKQDESKSDSGHGWLVTFIVRRITVSRWGQGLLLWIFLGDPCQTHFLPPHHHTHTQTAPVRLSFTPHTTHTHRPLTYTHRPCHSEDDPFPSFVVKEHVAHLSVVLL